MEADQMATVCITSLMRDLTKGQDQIKVDGETVGAIVDALEESYPGVRERLCTGDRLDPSITVLVDGLASPLGLGAQVPPGAEIHFLPVIGGG
jgi:molybdopterin converting factor small subunit